MKLEKFWQGDTLVSVWRETQHPVAPARSGKVLLESLQTFARHPMPVLVCSLLCFAGAAVVTSLIYVGLSFEAFLRAEAVFSMSQRIYLQQFYLRAALGACLYVLGRGALSWIALQPDTASVTAGRAMREAVRRWLPLTVSSLVYGALMTLFLFSVMAVLRELRLDPSNFRWLRSSDPSSLQTALGVQLLALAPPDPGSPFSEWLAGYRFHVSRAVGVTNYGWQSPVALATLSPQLLRNGLVGIFGMLAIEPLLCMRSAAVMAVSSVNARAWFHSTLAVSVANFGSVFKLSWGFRLIIISLITLGLTLPTLLQQGLVLPELARAVGSNWTYPVSIALHMVATAIITTLLTALQVIFEARMYATLRPTER